MEHLKININPQQEVGVIELPGRNVIKTETLVPPAVPTSNSNPTSTIVSQLPFFSSFFLFGRYFSLFCLCWVVPARFAPYSDLDIVRFLSLDAGSH